MMKTDNQDELYKLSKKLFAGTTDSKEKQQLANTDAVKRPMKRQWQQMGDSELEEEIKERIWNNVQKRCGHLRQRKVSRILWTWSAASIAALVVLGVCWYLWDRPQEVLQYDEVYANEYRMLLLPDSSKVWLQSGSSVKYARNFEEQREVWLKGNATFEVTRHEGSRFRVCLEKASIEVKGTVFQVNNQNADQSEITLLRGCIDLHVTKTGKVVTMRPNQCAILNKDGQVMMKQIDHVDWQDGRYKFNDTRLDSLVSVIRSLYGVEVVLADNVPGQSLYNGSIRYDEQPSAVIERICFSMNLEYREENNKIIVYNKHVIN